MTEPTSKGILISTAQDLRGRTAVVTGSSSGIGRAVAERLASEGVFVVLSGRDATSLHECAKRISDAGGKSVSVVTDIRDAKAVQGLVDTALKETGRLDIFVNNAGVSYLGNILDAEPESWTNMLETNVFSLLVGCQAAVRAMRASANPGHIVNISSVAALSPESGVYGATKHAVNVITNTLRAELVDDPIQVVTVMPGLVATNIGRNVDPAIVAGLVAMSGLEAEVRPGERLPDEVLQAAQAALGEIMIRPDDIAECVYFAVSQPAGVHIAEIVIRPNKDFEL